MALTSNANTDESMMWKMEELLQCMICFEAYRNPKMLQCAHTFCANCLADYEQTYRQQRRAVPGKLPCPTCRELTSLPPTGVHGLRNDFKVQKMEDLFRTMYVRQQQQQQQRAGGNDSSLCGPCQAQKKNRKAQSHCANCSMSYCETCLAKHNRNALFNSHKIVSVQSVAAASVTESLYCKKHPQEQGKYVCQSCHVIVCTVCIVNDHADHNVVEMTSVVRQQQLDVQSLRGVVDSKTEALKNRLAMLEALKLANKSSCQRSEAAISDHAKQTIEAVKREQVSLVEQLRTRLADRLASLDSELERVRYNISRTQAAGDYASSAAASVSVQMMALHDELVQRMRTVVDNDSAAAADDVDLQSVLSFTPAATQQLLGQIQLSRLSADELSRLQQSVARSSLAPAASPNRITTEVPAPVIVSRVPTANDRQPPAALSRAQSVNEARQSDGPSRGQVEARPTVGLQLTRSLLVETGRRPKLLVHIHSYGDKSGQLKDPLSIVWLPTGQLVVCEYGNKRLQVFDTSGRSLGLIASGQIGPQGLAMTLKGNIIASDTLQKRLQVFSNDGQSLTKWGLGKFFSPCGVAVSPNGNCIVTDIGDHSVSVYRGEQTCLGRFGSKGSHDVQLDNPLYVATGAHNEIVVSDSNNHCIKVFDSSGQFVRKIGGEGSGAGQLKFPRGVYVTTDGVIVVADRNNDRISLFSMTGLFIRHLVTKDDGLKAPYAVTVGPSGHLLLTESGNNRAAIKLFQL